ncbi:hypothetical protein GCM10027048_38500 [Hymenobacter coalescens]
MKRLLYASVCVGAGLLTACASNKPATSRSGTAAPRISGGNNAPQSYYDRAQQNVSPFVVLEVSDDASYGVTEQKPVCVGGMKDGRGVRNEQRYLNALRGPAGEAIRYRRLGSCCHCKTPNSELKVGLLDVYELTWEGGRPVTVYINAYDEAPLRAPKGLNVIQP